MDDLTAKYNACAQDILHQYDPDVGQRPITSKIVAALIRKYVSTAKPEEKNQHLMRMESFLFGAFNSFAEELAARAVAEGLDATKGLNINDPRLETLFEKMKREPGWKSVSPDEISRTIHRHFAP